MARELWCLPISGLNIAIEREKRKIIVGDVEGRLSIVLNYG